MWRDGDDGQRRAPPFSLDSIGAVVEEDPVCAKRPVLSVSLEDFLASWSPQGMKSMRLQ
jgi:hypothetical protein